MKLTKKDVLHIFSQRAQVNNHESNAMTSRQLAVKYGISERTIRDIWSRRSRRNITQPAWTVEEVLSENKRKRMGRPPGAKDTAPRRRNRASGSEQETSSSDDGTARQSDTTSSRNQSGGTNESTGDSNSTQQESSSGSNQENSSSGSAQENSSHGSGESSPQLQAPSDGEQKRQNDQLNQAVLSLLNHDFKQAQQARRGPVSNQSFSTSQSISTTNTLDAFQSAPNFPSFGTSQGLHQSFSWPSQEASQPRAAGLSGEVPMQFLSGYGSQVGAHQSSGYGSQMAANTQQVSVPLTGSIQNPHADVSLQSPSAHGQVGQAFANRSVVGGAHDASYGAGLPQFTPSLALNYGQQQQASDLSLQASRPLSTPTTHNLQQMQQMQQQSAAAVPAHAYAPDLCAQPSLPAQHRPDASLVPHLPSAQPQQVSYAGALPASSLPMPPPLEPSSSFHASPNLARPQTSTLAPLDAPLVGAGGAHYPAPSSSLSLGGAQPSAGVYGQAGALGAYMQRTQQAQQQVQTQQQPAPSYYQAPQPQPQQQQQQHYYQAPPPPQQQQPPVPNYYQAPPAQQQQQQQQQQQYAPQQYAPQQYAPQQYAPQAHVPMAGYAGVY